MAEHGGRANPGPGRRGYLSRLSRLLTEDLDTAENDRIAAAAAAAGGPRLADCVRGQEVELTGVLRTVETAARSVNAGVRAEFFDGSDILQLRWLGHHRIPGLEAGVRLTVRGRIGEADGVKVMYNPHYDLIDPEA